MRTPSEKLLDRLGIREPSVDQIHSEPKDSRRDFIRKAGASGLMLGAFMFSPIEETLAESTSKVNRNSAPSDLKITDMRYVVVMNGHARCPVIRIDTNQGIYGLGEVRDQASWRMRLAYFGGDNQAAEPEHEQAQRMYASGIVDELSFEYGGFVLKASLEKLEALPPPDCP